MSRIDKKRIARERGVDPANAETFKDKMGRFREKIKALDTWKKVLILVGLIVLAAIITVGIVTLRYVDRAVQTMQGPTVEPGVEYTEADFDLSLNAVDGYINLLALGVDARDMSNIKGTRSDMIMVISINQSTYDVKLTSVYRDTYTKIGDTPTYDKITHACAYGGPELTMKTLNQMLDIDLQNYVVVNFKAVADLVDAVGGIDVDVQEKEIYQLNKYTKQTAKNIGKKDYNLVKEAGMQRLEGVQAVSYGRIRKGVGDDIKRTERMRTVVSKTLEKLKLKSFIEIKEIADMMIAQVQTNLQTADILALGIRLPKYSITSGKSYPYNWTTGFINEISYLFSRDYAADTTTMHHEVFGQADYVPSSTVYTISNGVATRLAEARAKKELEDEEEGESLDTEMTGDEFTGEVVIDPVTGEPIDPTTGVVVDPVTGAVIDPITGLPLNPEQTTGNPQAGDPTQQPTGEGTVPGQTGGSQTGTPTTDPGTTQTPGASTTDPGSAQTPGTTQTPGTSQTPGQQGAQPVVPSDATTDVEMPVSGSDSGGGTQVTPNSGSGAGTTNPEA